MDQDLTAAMNLPRKGLYVLVMDHAQVLDDKRSRGTTFRSTSADGMPAETPPPGQDHPGISTGAGR